MQQFKLYIAEKLHINKDTKPMLQFNEIFDKGEECKFKDINIYKTHTRERRLNDPLFDKTVHEYFDDNDDVFIIKTENNQKIDNIIDNTYREEVCNSLSTSVKSLVQKIYLLNGRCGYNIKDVPSINAICLIKRFFDRLAHVEETHYIFKFKE